MLMGSASKQNNAKAGATGREVLLHVSVVLMNRLNKTNYHMTSHLGVK